jgi:hypothetical protein
MVKKGFLAAANPSGKQPEYGLFSLSIAGGEPEFLRPLDDAIRNRRIQAKVSPEW